MNIEGSWWVLIGTEKFDRNTAPHLDVRNGVLTWGDGTIGATTTREDTLWLKRELDGATPAETVHERYQITKTLDDGDVLQGRLYTPVGDLSAYHSDGLQADMTPFTLVRDGSSTLKAIETQQANDPKQAQLAESGEPITEHSAAPGGKLHGKWIVLVDDEAFDREHNRVVELDGGTVRVGNAEGAIESDGDALLVSTSPCERLVLHRISEDRNWLSGMIYRHSEPLAAGNPSGLWPADDVALDDAAYDDLPIGDPVSLIRDETADAQFAERSRFGDIDISMYTFWRQRASGFHMAESDDETEAALQQLPSAKVAVLEPV